MLTGIGVEGFKAFQEHSYLPFKKVNVFLGPNSSGKSSFLKALLLLKDSLSAEDLEASALILNEELGDFANVTYGKKTEGEIKFSFKFEKEKDPKFFLEATKANIQVYIASIVINGSSKDFTVEMLHEYSKEKTRSYIENPIEELSFSIKGDNFKNEISLMKLVFLNGEQIIIENKFGDYYVYQDSNQMYPKNIVEPDKFLFKVNERNILSCNKKQIDKTILLSLALFDIERQLIKFFKKIKHIEPFRYKPNRTEQITNIKQADSINGKGALTTLLALQNEKNNDKQIQVNEWLDEFDLAEEVNVLSLKENQYALMIKNKFTGIETNIKDVGVGTSQLLPIILESVLSEKSSVLLIEEPETHIHPNAQSQLADMFVRCAIEENKRFFIETHSIYLIQKLQILVAEEKVSPQDIGIYYFEQNAQGTKIKELELLRNGQFKEEFPKGFFDVAYKLSKEFMNKLF